ncbi:aconitate hydratase [Bradyrhizobium jicamae]|uniref:Aconitate hydratase n=1 Tax=Bradyrhizobium jicamae TaxID=280332 RepID=A0ABS5FEX5_9BRAD|nr:aconitate hydratase [Bradyrhizobium jicamae]MBR0795338.1 aconitate hydratase [Bradyrhizobium jicamae]MBR0932760.1 aconitate hydratase [Bradyrhizobium jicamae]
MPHNVAQKLILAHLVDGTMRTGSPIAIRVDQTLTQDATGTLVMLALEAMQLDRVRTELSAQYVDHNILQIDNLNAEDHAFLESACRRFGVWYSRPGNGISHVIHMQRFGRPGTSLLGSDSHTPAAGSLGMLAIGAGGLDVALAMSGEPFHLAMPKVFGVHLTGKLPDWVSAKDVILEMLRRHGVAGGVGRIIEYSGPGLNSLSAMDRHVIANMGAELGATTSVFPSDDETRRFMEFEGRASDWRELKADPGCHYEEDDSIDLSRLEPLIAKPSSPGNVVKVSDIEGLEIHQSYIGSSANPGWRDFAIAAEIVRGRALPSHVSFDVNPTSRDLLDILIADGHLQALVSSGARIHQAGCNGCIGMGQAPAMGRNSLRTTPRNFPGRSGSREDSVFLCSPETAAASALAGRITDPRSVTIPYPKLAPKARGTITSPLLEPPPSIEPGRRVELIKSPNIHSLPQFDALPEEVALPVLLKMGDDISTDEILPAGARVLPYRSNIQKIDDFSFERIDPSYLERARAVRRTTGHAVVAGDNYGQGSSREHAALAPRNLGLRLVLARGFARIHRQNLINYGVLPLVFSQPSDYERLQQGDVLKTSALRRSLRKDDNIVFHCRSRIAARHDLTPRELEVILAGGLINWRKTSIAAA